MTHRTWTAHDRCEAERQRHTAALRAAVIAEREACAKIVEDWPNGDVQMVNDIATFIRARGKP